MTRAGAAALAFLGGLCLTAAPTSAQDPRAAFNEAFKDAVTLGAGRAAGDFDRALARLDEAATLAAQLPATDLGRAQFAVGVRRAEVQLRAGRIADAVATVTAVYAAHRGDAQAFAGTHRVLLAVVAADCLPADAWAAHLVPEESFLADPATETLVRERVPSLHVPLRMLRAEFFARRSELERWRLWMQETAEFATADAELDPQWKRRCFGALAWHFLVLRDDERAALYLGHLPEAETRYPRALLALRRGDAPTAERIGLQLAAADPRFHALVGDAREVQGRHDEALTQYEAALAAARTPLDRAVASNGRGDCLLALGRLDDAAASYRAGLDALEGVADPHHAATERAEGEKDLGRVALRRGDRAAAEAACRLALAALDAARATIPIDAFGGRWLDAEFLAAVDVALQALDPDAARSGVAAFAIVEHGKARSLLDWAHRPPAADDASLLRAVGDLARTTNASALQDRLLELERTRAGGERRDVADAPPLLDDTRIAAWLASPGVVVVSYWVGAERAFAAVSRDGRARLVDLGPATQARDVRNAAMAAVRAPNGDPWPALTAASAFFLPESVRAQLPRATRVVVCPDATLHDLPFEALPLGEGSTSRRPLGIVAAVERAPSLSLRALLEQRRGGGDAFVVDSVAASADLTATFRLAPLRFSAREGDLVAARHGVAPSRRLQGEAATFAALDERLNAAPARIVHVSTHAIASPVVPSASLLLLADGPVSMPSVASLPMRGALVVLAACASAGGEARGGEGVSGLLMGAFGAGARTVVASSWPVDQQATADLMMQFHHALSGGTGEAEALRIARTTLAAAPQYAHPFYWAGFGVYGPDAAPKPSPWISIVGLLAFASIVGFGLVGHVRRQGRRTAPTSTPAPTTPPPSITSAGPASRASDE